MSIRIQTAKGAAWLSAGRLIGQGLSLVRNIIVARMIGPEDLGLAATFALTLSFIEAVSAISVDRLLVQAADGDGDRFQRTAHAAQAIRGALLGAVILGLSWGLASLFNAPGAVWAYQAVALVPLLRGLAHLDPKRVQRELNFAPDVKVEVLMQIGLLALAWPLCAWLKDYRAAALLTIISGALYLVLTHALAVRRYRWAWDRAVAHRIMVFGWPLLVNGLLMFLILQGDQFIIGSSERLLGVAYTHGDLGQFVAAAGLALALQAAGASVAASLFLPLLARVQDDAERFRHRYALCLEGLTAASCVLGAVGILTGRVLIEALYGSRYEIAGRVFPWLMAMQMVRLLRVAPTLASMARADTAATMIANGVRVIGFGGAVVVAASGGTLEAIAMAGLGAELLACVAALVRMESRSRVGLATSVVPISMGIAILGMALIGQRWTVGEELGRLTTALIAMCAAGVCLLLLLMLLPASRREAAFFSRRWLHHPS